MTMTSDFGCVATTLSRMSYDLKNQGAFSQEHKRMLDRAFEALHRISSEYAKVSESLNMVSMEKEAGVHQFNRFRTSFRETFKTHALVPRVATPEIHDFLHQHYDQFVGLEQKKEEQSFWELLIEIAEMPEFLQAREATNAKA